MSIWIPGQGTNLVADSVSANNPPQGVGVCAVGEQVYLGVQVHLAARVRVHH